MNRTTLRMCPLDQRGETLRSFEKRLGRAAKEMSDCADIAQQLDLVPTAVELRDVQAKVDAVRLGVVGAAR